MRRILRILSTACALALALSAAPSVFAASLHSVSGPFGSSVLREGDQGQPVAMLQGDLLQFGYDPAPSPTGIFDPATMLALLAFQRDHGLPTTGVLDQGTFDAILLEGGWQAPWSASGDVSAGASPRDTVRGAHTLSMVATAYGPSAQDNYPYGATDYFGQPLVVGDVAVDPSVIPLGTRLYITGYHSPYLPPGGLYAVADDEGDAIQGNRIDIFIDGTERQVQSFGIQHVNVTVLGR